MKCQLYNQLVFLWGAQVPREMWYPLDNSQNASIKQHSYSKNTLNTDVQGRSDLKELFKFPLFGDGDCWKVNILIWSWKVTKLRFYFRWLGFYFKYLLSDDAGVSCDFFVQFVWNDRTIDKVWGHFKNAYKLLNAGALQISTLYKNHIFQCIGQIFCKEFQRYPLKFRTKYLTRTLKDVYLIHRWKFKSSQI